MRTYATETDMVRVDADARTPLIRWSAVFGGLVLGLALLILLTTLWLALAHGSDVTQIRNNLEWYIGGSAVLALFVGAIVTGYLSGVRRAGTGMLHGFALWGLLLLIGFTVGIPAILNVFSLGRIVTEASDTLLSPSANAALWATFWTILGGFVAAGIGGAIGGATSPGARTREVGRTTPADTVVVDDDDDDDDDDVTDRDHVTTSRAV